MQPQKLVAFLMIIQLDYMTFFVEVYLYFF